MKNAARLLLAGALAAASFSVAAAPASACDDPRKCAGGCKPHSLANIRSGYPLIVCHS